MPGTSCHAAIGIRILPAAARRLGNFITLPIASTAPLRTEPDCSYSSIYMNSLNLYTGRTDCVGQTNCGLIPLLPIMTDT